jgi:hypothetical protein
VIREFPTCGNVDVIGRGGRVRRVSAAARAPLPTWPQDRRRRSSRCSIPGCHRAGGPLIVPPQPALSAWTGATDTDGPLAGWGDYGRACAVNSYIGLIAIGEWQALVLGDEPATTTSLPKAWLFLRWQRRTRKTTWSAPRAERYATAWSGTPDQDIVWKVDGPVVMFDSTYPATELEPDNHLVVDPHPGTYRARATYRADGDNWMILVQLQPTQLDHVH